MKKVLYLIPFLSLISFSAFATDAFRDSTEAPSPKHGRNVAQQTSLENTSSSHKSVSREAAKTLQDDTFSQQKQNFSHTEEENLWKSLSEALEKILKEQIDLLWKQIDLCHQENISTNNHKKLWHRQKTLQSQRKRILNKMERLLKQQEENSPSPQKEKNRAFLGREKARLKQDESSLKRTKTFLK